MKLICYMGFHMPSFLLWNSSMARTQWGKPYHRCFCFNVKCVYSLLCWFALIGKIACLWGICLSTKVNPWSWPYFVKLDPEVATELPILRQANIDCYWTNKKENTMEPRFSMLVVIKAVVQIYWCRSFNCNTVEW